MKCCGRGEGQKLRLWRKIVLVLFPTLIFLHKERTHYATFPLEQKGETTTYSIGNRSETAGPIDSSKQRIPSLCSRAALCLLGTGDTPNFPRIWGSRWERHLGIQRRTSLVWKRLRKECRLERRQCFGRQSSSQQWFGQRETGQQRLGQ